MARDASHNASVCAYAQTSGRATKHVTCVPSQLIFLASKTDRLSYYTYYYVRFNRINFSTLPDGERSYFSRLENHKKRFQKKKIAARRLQYSYKPLRLFGTIVSTNYLALRVTYRDLSLDSSSFDDGKYIWAPPNTATLRAYRQTYMTTN